jgi:hypothetical protein
VTNIISTPWTCQRCGAAYISAPPDTGICRDCTVTQLRDIFYGPPTPAHLALTSEQAVLLQRMLGDATAYRAADASWCPRCQGTPAEDCHEHARTQTLILEYRQLAADLGCEVPGDDH